MKSYFRILAIFLLFPLAVAAQSQKSPQSQSQPSAPSTDIFVAALKLNGENLTVGKPANVTRRKGYDNQPRFLPDGRSFYYTSIREDGQADIYQYDLKTGAAAQITHTPENEFSPTLMPDGKHISVVRVEADSTQRLWKFPLEGGEPTLVLENVKRVGYHAWVNAGTVVLFILGEPNTLQVADIATGATEVIAEDVGRCIQNIPGSDAVSFAQKGSEKGWYIMRWIPAMHAAYRLTAVNGDEADFAWLPDGTLLAASGSKILHWNPKAGWLQVADFAGAGMRNITRMAVSPQGDRLALVAGE